MSQASELQDVIRKHLPAEVGALLRSELTERERVFETQTVVRLFEIAFKTCDSL